MRYLLVLLMIVLAGCASAARYTWTGNASGLARVHARCDRESLQGGLYMPRAALETLYKDCMEKAGYVKVAGDRVPLTWDWTLGAHRLEACGRADQTCYWVGAP
jgi:uncharacterized protein YceK